MHMNGRIFDPTLGRFLQARSLCAGPGQPAELRPLCVLLQQPADLHRPERVLVLVEALEEGCQTVLLAAWADATFCGWLFCTAALNAYSAYKAGGADFRCGSEHHWHLAGCISVTRQVKVSLPRYPAALLVLSFRGGKRLTSCCRSMEGGFGFVNYLLVIGSESADGLRLRVLPRPLRTTRHRMSTV